MLHKRVAMAERLKQARKTRKPAEGKGDTAARSSTDRDKRRRRGVTRED
jgi:hypothetical protein